MPWTVDLHPDFDAEFKELSEGVQDQLIVKIMLLEEFGPELKRPYVDTLKGSKHKQHEGVALQS